MPKLKSKSPLTGETKEGDILSESEELFCQTYVKSFDRIEAVDEAYDLDKKNPRWRMTASEMAYENLKKPHINRRIRELVDKYHLNDENVDTELSNLIQQNAELHVKAKAVDIYNKLKGRYESKIKHTFEGISDEELEKRAAEIIAGVIGDTGGDGEEGAGESS